MERILSSFTPKQIKPKEIILSIKISNFYLNFIKIKKY